jgi:glycosyltransferase involved in cell wall biosynthesis
MRVLLVSGIWPPAVGGPASHGPEFGRFLVDRGHHVRAATSAGSLGWVDPGFPVLASRSDRPLAIRQAAAVSVLLRAARGADLVYATGMYTRSALTATAHRIPLVVKLVCDPAYERARRLGLYRGSLEDFQDAPSRGGLRYLRLARKLTLERASRIVIPSRYLAAIASGWGVPHERVSVIPNPSPPIEGSETRKELRERLDVGFPTFVFAGRLVPQKNVALAVRALRGLPTASLVVIGDGESRGQLMRAIVAAGVGDRVAVKGARPRHEALEWLRAADAAILPSDWENFPHAAVEALAAGTPVIATAVGGVPEIIESGVNGILVEPGDAEALCTAMASIASDHELLESLRSGARAAAPRYRRESVYAALEGELERAAAQSRGRDPSPAAYARFARWR